MSLLLLYSIAIIAVSLFGGVLPSLISLTHTRMQVIMSAVSGLMLGVALFHLLPHSLEEMGEGSIHQVSVGMMGGLLGMFLLLRAFHFHQHDFSEASPDHCHPDHAAMDHGHHLHETASEHAIDPAQEAHPGVEVHNLSWMGVALGLGLHTLIDGIALGAAVQADMHHTDGAGMISLGVFIALLLHKPLDALSITSLMAGSGASLNLRRWVNIAFALMCPAGAVLFIAGVGAFPEFQHQAVGLAMAFSAGVFLCISLSDLLPEVQFHSHDRGKLTIALFAGIALAWSLLLLE